MLTVNEAIPFLLEHRLIDRGWIIDGDLAIRCSAKRNRNLRVEGPDGRGFLIKQPDDPVDGGFETLRSESAFYGFCRGEPAVAAVRSIIPRLSYRDADRALLALELVPDAVTLWSCYTDHDAVGFPFEVGVALGQALGTVHRIFGRLALLEDPRLAWLGRPIPWALRLTRPGPGFVADLSPAGAQTIRILQRQDGLVARLDGMRERWRAETLVHGDIKSDNVLAARPRPEAPWEIRIVDWEMVQIGDPAWDLAGALQDFIGFWVSSMPLAVDMSIEERAARARHPLDVVQEAIRATCRGYRAAIATIPPDADELLHRAVGLSAVRMFQTAYELSCDRAELHPRSVILLQIGANILADPDRALDQLYGLPPRLPLT